jgi:hypothetical protein
MTTNPVAQQIGPNQTFGAHILIPRATPLFDTEVPNLSNEPIELSFFGWTGKMVVFNQKRFRKAKTRSVLKLIEWGLIHPEIRSEDPNTRVMASPIAAIEGHVVSGDVVLGLDNNFKPARALILCQNDFTFKDGCVKFGFLVLWAEGDRWGKRVKKLSLFSVSQAYDLVGPEVCMAIEARASASLEIQMAGEAREIQI